MASTPFDLSGRDIWVFGGAGYLGQPTVALLAQLGARVLCVDLEGRAEAFLSKTALGDSVTAASLDVRDGAAIREFVSSRQKLRGAPRGLVVMTCASTAKRLDDLTESDFDSANHGNLTATFLLARETGNAMAVGGGGSIVLFSSMYGSVAPDPRIYEPPANPNPIEYGVAKAGIRQMARYLAVHWGPSGVRVNSLSPGPFPNRDVQRDSPAFVRRLSEKTPLRRIGRSGEIAGAVVFLLSDAASYVTGHDLAVDGGWTAW